MKNVRLLSTVVLGGMLLLSPLSTVDASAQVTTQAQSVNVVDEVNGIILNDGETLSDYGNTITTSSGEEVLQDASGRSSVAATSTSTVKTWVAFRTAVNNSNVGVINVACSFNSSLLKLNTVNRPLVINFINNSTINMNDNHSLHVGYGGSVTFMSNSTAPIITNGNQVKQPFVQGDWGSNVTFSGNVVVGNTNTQSRQHPFIRTAGSIQIPSGSNVVMNEAIETNQLNIINYGQLTVRANLLTPIEITTNGRLNAGQYSSLIASHSGANPVIRMAGSGYFLIDNPYQIHLAQTGTGAMYSPLVQALGTNIQINAARNAFWANNNFGWSPSQYWSPYLQAQLTGVNGSQVLQSNLASFSQNFMGFQAYREYTAGTGAPQYTDTFPLTESR
ncbi:hypothetical protein A5886_000964 [Enterococcus sp. 8G7_MSG3316]|uniref:Uncharacterized protein n=1 Tax=Candidatus Enterococcus testudinis TaxID=1834191 RepID=A0A242A4B8_9ENTE|nr:hypothetical protein [Enterococcus sp. 8G7_MSG3316]OTN75888.1 hypothetical protein A5886_000964 [Enterococcus sp. 8G7_MSG3316]